MDLGIRRRCDKRPYRRRRIIQRDESAFSMFVVGALKERTSEHTFLPELTAPNINQPLPFVAFTLSGLSKQKLWPKSTAYVFCEDTTLVGGLRERGIFFSLWRITTRSFDYVSPKDEHNILKGTRVQHLPTLVLVRSSPAGLTGHYDKACRTGGRVPNIQWIRNVKAKQNGCSLSTC